MTRAALLAEPHPAAGSGCEGEKPAQGAEVSFTHAVDGQRLQNQPQDAGGFQPLCGPLGGQSLRALLWSIYNDAVRVPLWSTLTDLDDPTRKDLTKILMLDMDGRAAVIGGILHASGEWDRIDTQPLQWSSAD